MLLLKSYDSIFKKRSRMRISIANSSPTKRACFWRSFGSLETRMEMKIILSIPYSQFEWWIALLEITTFFIVSFLLYLSWKKKIRLSYLIFSVPCFLLPIFSGTFTGLPRYSLVLFPIFISLALINQKLIKLFYVIIAPILLFLLLMFFSKGYFIS